MLVAAVLLNPSNITWWYNKKASTVLMSKEKKNPDIYFNLRNTNCMKKMKELLRYLWWKIDFKHNKMRKVNQALWCKSKATSVLDADILPCLSMFKKNTSLTLGSCEVC